MKIGFWSPLHGQTCTANMVAIALVTALRYSRKTVITQTHYNLNNLEAPVVGKRVTTDKEYFSDIGYDALQRHLLSGPLTEEIVENCMTTIIEKKINLLVGTKQMSRDIYLEESTKVMISILRALDQYHDVVFVDVNSGNNENSMQVLKEVDMIVVNLRQNKAMIESFFEQYADYGIPTEKFFFLFGMYDDDSRYTLKNIRRKYSEIKKNNSAVVPYNVQYSDAFSDHRVQQYIERNLYAEEDNTSKYFIDSVNDAASKILKKVGLERIMDGEYNL